MHLLNRFCPLCPRSEINHSLKASVRTFFSCICTASSFFFFLFFLPLHTTADSVYFCIQTPVLKQEHSSLSSHDNRKSNLLSGVCGGPPGLFVISPTPHSATNQPLPPHTPMPLALTAPSLSPALRELSAQAFTLPAVEAWEKGHTSGSAQQDRGGGGGEKKEDEEEEERKRNTTQTEHGKPSNSSDTLTLFSPGSP